MTFDPTQPEDTTKIRNLGIVIRPNWQAIEEGNSTFKPSAVNLNNRTPLPVSDDPAAIPDAFTLFCKETSAGDPELYAVNENDDKIQMTAGDVVSGLTGHSFLPGGILVQWNRVVVSSGNTIIFPIPFSAAPYFVSFIPTGSSNTNRIFFRLNGLPVAASFSPIILNREGGSLTERIYYIALGPR